MKIRAALILLAVLVASGLILIFLSSGPEHERSGESGTDPEFSPAHSPTEDITIRNLTRSRVPYVLRPSRGQEPARRENVLKPGAVHSIRTSAPIEICFDNGGEDMSFTLDPGASYTFRYDENEQAQIFLGAHGRDDAADLAPFVPTPQPVVERMLELAEVTDKDIVYDLGSGDGRIVITAAKRFGARGVGIEIDPELVRRSEASAAESGVTERVRFLGMDAGKADLSPATVVTLYLLPESNALLRPQFERQLRPGARVVSHNFTIPGWENPTIAYVRMTETGGEHKIYLYRR